MNEQIEAYLRQHHHYGYFDKHGETVIDPHYFMYREEVDGLIELIVREAARVANENVGAFTPSCGNFVMDHFGVKR